MRTAVAVALAHAATDAYVGFLHPLLPRIMERLGLTIALAATLAVVLSISTSLLQPLVGWLADRYGRRGFVVAGPLLSAVFLSLIGVAPSFAVLVALLAVGGLGSAAFHPPGASLAVRVSEGGGSGLRYSIFSFAGSAGYAVGPLAAVAVVAVLGLPGLAWAMVPGVVLAIALLRVLPADAPAAHAEPPPGPAQVLRLLRGPVGVLFCVSALGAFAQRVFLTMTPIAVADAGGSEAAGALLLSVYLAGQAAGSLLGGYLTDRMARRTLLAWLTALAVPAHAAAGALPAGSLGAFAAAFAAGTLGMALLPPVVVAAQELMPAAATLGSGIVMGLAWACGSVLVLGTGVLGDVVGAAGAALLSYPLLFVGTALVLLAGRALRRPPAQATRALGSASAS